MTGKNRIMIYGPKNDRTYIIEFKTAAGEALASAHGMRCRGFRLRTCDASAVCGSRACCRLVQHCVRENYGSPGGVQRRDAAGAR
jgi:hypothetical protein